MTNEMTDTAKSATAQINMGVVFLRNASLHPTDFTVIFSRILLSTCINDDQATTVMAATKLKEEIFLNKINGTFKMCWLKNECLALVRDQDVSSNEAHMH